MPHKWKVLIQLWMYTGLFEDLFDKSCSLAQYIKFNTINLFGKKIKGVVIVELNEKSSCAGFEPETLTYAVKSLQIELTPGQICRTFLNKITMLVVKSDLVCQSAQ